MRSLKQSLYVHGCISALFVLRTVKMLLCAVGESLKSVGRRMVRLGEDHTREWGAELLLRCHMIDIELHIGSDVYRGPVYAVHRDIVDSDSLVLRFNWVAMRKKFGISPWKYLGSCTFRLAECSKPGPLPNGDYHFGFRTGYGVLYLGEPHSNMTFKGTEDTPREFAYF